MDFAQEWSAVFVVRRKGEVMNYSLVGKARVAAKNTMQSKTARSANVANYANHIKNSSTKTSMKWSFDGQTLAWVCKKMPDRSKSLKVI